MTRHGLALTIGFGLLASPIVGSAAPVYVDDDPSGNAGGFFATGPFIGPDVPANGENAISDDFLVGTSPGVSTATYSPSLPAGTYYVQAHWTVNAGHTPTANYDVAGTDVLVDQRLTASQGAPGTWPATGDIPSDGSGWYTLGQFALTPTSTVVLTHGSGPLIADGIRFSTDFVEDERRATLTGTWTSETLTGGDPESTQYLNSTVGSSAATYRPGVTGFFDVSASWAVDSDNTTSASYVVDLDGVPGGGDATTFFRDQSGPAGGTWSGYSLLGTFLLNPNSTITLSNAAGTGSLTADGLLIAPGIPEPATAALLTLGAGILSMSRRRRRG